MPSPFPGMNPYLEQPHLWRTVHNGLLYCLQAAIVPLIVPRYYCQSDSSLYIDEPADGGRLFGVADMGVSREPNSSIAGGATAVASAPVTSRLTLGVRRAHRWLTIRDSESREVVTVIEVLSPSNKEAGDDRSQYLRKRQRVARSAAHFLEIDLLRGGHRSPVARPPRCDYRVLLSRRPERPRVGLWPLGLRDPLPAIPIPLRTGEPEPTVELKGVLDRVYDEGGYAYRIYDRDPTPSLPAADAAWARQFVPRQGAA